MPPDRGPRTLLQLASLRAKPETAARVGVLLLLVLSLGASFVNGSPVASSAFQPHQPILIDGNTGFTTANGVTGGRGTRSDPYIIQGWDIAGSSVAAIEIQNTNAYFVIRNVYIHSSNIGIWLSNANNGRVENSHFADNVESIRLDSASSSITVTGNEIRNGGTGIFALGTASIPINGITITNNTMVLPVNGVEISSSSAVTISENTITLVIGTPLNPESRRGAGVQVTDSYDMTISRNTVSNGAGGIIVSGHRIVLTGNNVSRNVSGIAIQGSDISLSDNVLTLNGVRVLGASAAEFNSYAIARTNLVNGKPLYYYKGCDGISLENVPVGELIVANCQNVRASHLQIADASAGIELAFVKGASIEFSDISNNSVGIEIINSDNVSIRESYFETSARDLWVTAVEASVSSNINLIGNTFSAINETVWIRDSRNVTLTNNYATQSSAGTIGLSNVTGVTMSGNMLIGNRGEGVLITGSSDISLSNNTSTHNDVGISLNQVVNVILSANLVSNNGCGICVRSANGLNITKNVVAYNGVGLSLSPPAYLDCGCYEFVFNAIVYRNDFTFNSQHQGTYNSRSNIRWDAGYPTGGNYWSEYTGADECSGPQQSTCPDPDGLGDTPYAGLQQVCDRAVGNVACPDIAQVDHYPLIHPFGKYSQDKAPPVWPPSAKLTGTFVNSTTVILSWSSATDNTWVASYHIYKDQTLIAILTGARHNFTLSGLTLGVTYVFRVEAGDPTSNWSTSGPSLNWLQTKPSQNSSSMQQYTYPIIAGTVLLGAIVAVVILRRKSFKPSTSEKADK